MYKRQPLRRLAEELGGRPIELAPGTRALYHAAAVLAGNAPLALLSAASELLVAAGLEPEIAEQGPLALMEGALANARRVGPRAAVSYTHLSWTPPCSVRDASTAT